MCVIPNSRNYDPKVRPQSFKVIKVLYHPLQWVQVYLEWSFIADTDFPATEIAFNTYSCITNFPLHPVPGVKCQFNKKKTARYLFRISLLVRLS